MSQILGQYFIEDLVKKNIYRITIKNWEKYNGTLKKGHKKVMVSTSFLSDAKIRSLTPVTKLLYLSCILVAGELTQSQIEVSHDSLVFQSGVKSGSLQSQLDLLQSLQLVTYEKVLPNRIEMNRKEEKRIEEKGEQSKLRLPASPSIQEIIAHYCDCWKSRYGASAPISGKTSGQLKQFVKDHGFEKSKILISAYLDMADGWFITKRHDVPTLLGNINSVALFSETGKMITRREVSNLDSVMTTKNLIDQIKKEGV